MGRHIAELAELSIEQSVAEVRSELEEMLRETPPPSNVNAIFFELVDGVDEAEEQCVFVCVAGLERFDGVDSLSSDDSVWTAENRGFGFDALDAITKAEHAAIETGREDESSLLGHTAQLAAALLVWRFATKGLFDARTIVVGYEGGDFAVVS